MDCIFCKIVSGEIPSKKVFENDTVLAFDDIAPRTPVHTLIIPKVHIEDINSLDENNSSIMTDIFLAAKEIARIKGVEKKGYRVLMNNGKAAHQEVLHLHLHLFAGKDSLGPMIKR